MGGVKRVTSTSHVRLLTAVSARKDAGSSPTGIVGRSLARHLLDAGDRVRVLAEPGLLDGWPDGAAVAATALRADDHVGAVLEAVGMPISTRSRVAGIAEAMGCDIAAVELTPDESRANWWRRGRPDSGIDVTLYALQEYGARLAELTRWTLDQRPPAARLRRLGGGACPSVPLKAR